ASHPITVSQSQGGVDLPFTGPISGDHSGSFGRDGGFSMGFLLAAAQNRPDGVRPKRKRWPANAGGFLAITLMPRGSSNSAPLLLFRFGAPASFVKRPCVRWGAHGWLEPVPVASSHFSESI